MQKVSDAVKLFRQVSPDYAFDDDIMVDEDERIHRLKYILNRKLSPSDKTYIILYAELQSYRELGEKVGLSHTTIANEINRIKKLIKQEFEQMK